MKKYCLLSLLFLPFFVFATDGEYRDFGNADSDHLLNVIDTATTVFFWLIIAGSAIFFLLAAYQFLFSGGDSEKVKKARNNILYAVLAVVIALLAQGSISIIEKIFQIEL